ncbi:MAG: MBL fold metallo-hydrolase [Chitinophagales bacterium]|nr:MBL fold metallo-hydrolase [Chitinophagales bacterium]
MIGCTCEACTSSDVRDKRLRTAALVQYTGKNIAIDCGPDFRQQMLTKKVQHLDAILMTHEHNDHIIGLDDVRPFNFSQRKDMPVYCLPRVRKELEHRFEYIFVTQNKYPGAPMVQLLEIGAGETLLVEGINILPVEVMHGPLPILGYRFGPITYLTDVKTLSDETIKQIKGTRSLIINALHRDPHYSHLSLNEALLLIEKIVPERAFITHVSHRMGTYEKISELLPENVTLGYDGLEIIEDWT